MRRREAKRRRLAHLSATVAPSTIGHSLHETFLKAVDNALREFVEKILVEKLAAQHVRLSAAERERVHKCVLSGDFSQLAIERSRPITIKWTAADNRRLERRYARIVKRMPMLIKNAVNGESRRMIGPLRRSWRQHARYEDSLRQGFHQRLYQRWRRPLDGLRRIVTIAREFSEMVGGTLQDSRTHENQHLIAVVVRLHARACQVADEILVLLKAGLADGAIARWRTLHEIAVVAIFIRDHGDPIAERYLLHEHIENYRAMIQYQQHARRLKLKPYSAEEVGKITKIRDELLAKFGKGFGSEYGWAGRHPDDRPTLDRLEEAAIASHWRPYYKLASHNVHANAKGILYKMGLLPSENVLLTGPSNYGLADAGQNTAITLMQISAALGTIEPTIDSLVLLKVLHLLVPEVGKDFVAAQRQFHG